MTVSDPPSGAISATRPRPAYLEWTIWLVLCAAYIWLISLGDENGQGYFHQPQQSLVAPLVVGGIINAALFWGNAFYAIPQFLERGRWQIFAAVLLALTAASIALQTVTQKLIITFIEPELSTLTWSALVLENLYLPPFVLILSALYKFSRDWAGHLRERRTLSAESGALKQALQETRDEMRILSSAGRPENFLQINVGNEKLQIPVGAIQYIKSAGNYVDIVTPENTYLAYGALKDILNTLPAERFARIHRSYVIGMEHIRMIKGDAIHLGNHKLPIGALYKNAFLELWKSRAAGGCKTAEQA